jgi:hypothetical protein
MLTACSGKLVALSTIDGGPENDPMGGTGSGTGSGSGSGSGGSTSVGPPVPVDCAEAIFTKPCALGDTVAKCVTCSGIFGCHGKDPILPGWDLSAEGLAASQGGQKFINRPANDTPDGVCGDGAVPPVAGKVIVDPIHPENSLLYQKVTTNYLNSPGFCGSRMPFAATRALTVEQQQCILAWIKKIPGVNAGP